MALATNLQLTYDDATNQWNFTEVAYDYGAQTAPSWSGYTATDPAFEYATEGAATTTESTYDSAEGDDPCPPGYVYDNNLKQCVSDPTYEAPAYAGQPKGEYSSEAGPSERTTTSGIPTATTGAGSKVAKAISNFTATDIFNFGTKTGLIDDNGRLSKATLKNLSFPSIKDYYDIKAIKNQAIKLGIWNPDTNRFGQPVDEGTGTIDFSKIGSKYEITSIGEREAEVGENDIFPDYLNKGYTDVTTAIAPPTPPGTSPSGPEIMGWDKTTVGTSPDPTTIMGWSNYANTTALGITAPSYVQRQPFYRLQDVSGGPMSIGERMQHEQEQLKEKQEKEKLKQQEFKTQRELTRLEKERRELGPSPQLTSEQRQPSKFTAVEKERRQARQAADKAMENAAKRESAAIRGGNKQAAQRARSDYQTAVERAGYSRK